MRANMPIPGSVAEIKSAPGGPDVIAFFDLDGTIISGFSASHLTKDRLKNKELGLLEMAKVLSLAVHASVGKAQFDDLLKLAALSWQGRCNQELLDAGERLFQKTIVNLIFPEMKRMIRAHQEAGHTVVVSSSATAYQVEPVARFLEIEHVICNRFSTDDDGNLNGDLERPTIWGKGKANAAQTFAAERGLNLKHCYFYADGDEDIALMHMVGHPRPINPRKRMTRVAKQRGWPINRFNSRDLNSPLRTLAGVASFLPIGLVGAGVGLLRGDRRAAMNFTAPLWFDTLFKINGVTLNVIGRENLWQQRPAVFIFNHRNNFDGFMVAQLVEKNWAIVAKKELREHFLMGALEKFGDVVFIDRNNSRASVKALRELEEKARQGISIILSPEGTRYDTETVGPFKKGAFRMALATGLPIVPIVVRNADDVAARSSTVLSPGVVDIAALPPIDTSDWNLKQLDHHITEVQQLFVDTLLNWPSEDQLLDWMTEEAPA